MTRPRTYARYIVVRPGPGLPAGYLPPGLDGTWFEPPGEPYVEHDGGAVAVASGRYEVRDDGELAEVYEVHACDSE